MFLSLWNERYMFLLSSGVFLVKKMKGGFLIVREIVAIFRYSD